MPFSLNVSGSCAVQLLARQYQGTLLYELVCRVTHLLAMKFGFGRVRPKVALYSSRILSSSLYSSVEAMLVVFQERKSNSAHDMYPPGSRDTCQLIVSPLIQKANTD